MTVTDVKTRLYERIEHLDNTQLKELYNLVNEMFPRDTIEANSSRKRRLGTMKGKIRLSDDWDSDEVNEEIARTFYEGAILPDTYTPQDQ